MDRSGQLHAGQSVRDLREGRDSRRQHPNRKWLQLQHVDAYLVPGGRKPFIDCVCVLGRFIRRHDVRERGNAVEFNTVLGGTNPS
jgi:hypothetical protein